MDECMQKLMTTIWLQFFWRVFDSKILKCTIVIEFRYTVLCISLETGSVPRKIYTDFRTDDTTLESLNTQLLESGMILELDHQRNVWIRLEL